MNNSFDQWVQLLARYYNLDINKQKNGYRLKAVSDEGINFIGSKRPVSILQSPVSKKSWEYRLQLIEKTAARALISAPVGFCCKIGKQDIDTNEEKKVTVFRLAFGFSLSHGKSLRQRFTAYYVTEWDKPLHICGVDKLFSRDYKMKQLNLEKQIVKKGMTHLLNEVHRVQEIYSKSDAILSEVDKLRQSLIKELRDLDRIYTVNYGQYARLLGRATDNLRGEDAIESEYLNRMEVIFNRYQPKIIFEPLTFGVIYCHIEVFEHLASHKLNLYS